MKQLVFIFITACILISSSMVLAAETTGTITGRLINGSTVSDTVGGLSLTLEAYGANDVEPVITEAVSDGEGIFRFTGLNPDSTITYYVAAEYLGVTYYSEPVSFTADITAIEVEVPIYETSQNDDYIEIALSHTIITVDEEGLTFTEFFIIENTGDHTFIGSGQVVGTGSVTLIFPMPEDAEHIEIGAEIADDVIFTNAGLVYSGPVKPGYTPATYSYHLHTSQSKYIFTRQVAYSQDRYELLVQGTDKIDSPLLTRNEALVIENVAYAYFSGTGIAANEVLTIQLDGLKSNPVQTILWVGGVLALLVAGSVFLMRRGSGGTVTHTADRRNLLLQIALLDDEYENGNIQEDEYRSKRAKLKKDILMMGRLPEDEG